MALHYFLQGFKIFLPWKGQEGLSSVSVSALFPRYYSVLSSKPKCKLSHFFAQDTSFITTALQNVLFSGCRETGEGARVSMEVNVHWAKGILKGQYRGQAREIEMSQKAWNCLPQNLFLLIFDSNDIGKCPNVELLRKRTPVFKSTSPQKVKQLHELSQSVLEAGM